MDDAERVGVLERAQHVGRDLDGLLELELAPRRRVEEALDVAAGQERAHQVGPPVVLARLLDGDDVGVVAEPSHRLRLAPRARQDRLLDALGLEYRDRDVAVALGVARQIDALAPAAPEEALDAVAAAPELGGQIAVAVARRRRGGGGLGLGRGLGGGAELLAARVAEPRALAILVAAAWAAHVG